MNITQTLHALLRASERTQFVPEGVEKREMGLTQADLVFGFSRSRNSPSSADQSQSGHLPVTLIVLKRKKCFIYVESLPMGY